MQTAELLVEVRQTCRHARQGAFAPVRCFRQIDRVFERLGEGLEAALRTAAGGEVEQALFRAFDLVRRGLVELHVERAVDHLLADVDQLPAEEQVVDDLAVLAGIDDGHDAVREPGDVFHATGGDHQFIALEVGFQRDRIGLVALLDQLDQRGVDAGIGGICEMIRQQVVAHLFVRAVVEKDRPQ